MSVLLSKSGMRCFAAAAFLIVLSTASRFCAMAEEPKSDEQVRKEFKGTQIKAVETKTAVLAGGCFWCIQPAFDKAPGVVKTLVGYAGGTEPNPTYELVGSEKTKYRESIEITYDPAKISFAQLLDIYWKQINPTQSDGQFSDIGPSYRAAIFVSNDEEKKIAEASKEKLSHSGKFDRPIVTEILPAMKFYPAEDYHQKYYQQNPEHFEAFEKGSGRVSFEKKTWGDGH